MEWTPQRSLPSGLIETCPLLEGNGYRKMTTFFSEGRTSGRTYVCRSNVVGYKFHVFNICVVYCVECGRQAWVDLFVGLFSCACSGLSMQADDAEQATAGISRLRGRKPRETSEDVRSQMGVRFYASRSSGQVSVISFRVF